jgi:hypothetical protein
LSIGIDAKEEYRVLSFGEETLFPRSQL